MFRQMKLINGNLAVILCLLAVNCSLTLIAAGHSIMMEYRIHRFAQGLQEVERELQSASDEFDRLFSDD